MTATSGFGKDKIDNAQKKLDALCDAHGVERFKLQQTKEDSRLWHSLVLKMCGLQTPTRGRPEDPQSKETGELAYLLSDFWSQIQREKTGQRVQMGDIYDEVIKTLNIQPKQKAHGGITNPRNTVRRAYQAEKTTRQPRKHD